MRKSDHSASGRFPRPRCSLWRYRPARPLYQRDIMLFIFAALVIVMLLRTLVRGG